MKCPFCNYELKDNKDTHVPENHIRQMLNFMKIFMTVLKSFEKYKK